MTTSALTPLVMALWGLNIVLDTGGQLAFKAAASDEDAGVGLARWGHMASRPWLWLGIGCYVIEFLVWIAFLSLVPLSEGVLLGSISMLTIMLAGRCLFGEKLTPLRVGGILLVALGVTIVAIAG